MLIPSKPPIRILWRALLVPILAGVLSVPLSAADDVEESADAEPADEIVQTIDRNEVISIGSDGYLRANETADEMVTIFGNAVVEGTVWNECVTVLGNATINGYVGNEVVCILGNLTIGPDAEIRGEIVAIGGTVEIDPAAEINGDINQIGNLGPLKLPSMAWVGEWITDGLMQGRILPHQHAWAWEIGGVLLILNLLFAILFRRPVDACVSALDRKPAMSLVNGVLFLLLYPAIIFILAVSVVGVFVIPFLMAGKFLAGIIGVIAVYRYSGSQFGLRDQPIIALVAGNLIFLGLYAVPIVGIAVWIIAGLVGTGCVLTAMFDSMRSETDKPRAPVAAPTPTAAAVAAGATSQATPALSNPFQAAAETGNPAPGASGLAEAEVAEQTQPAPAVTVPPEPPAGIAAADFYPRVGFWPRLGATALDFFLVAGLTAFLSIPSALIPIFLIYHMVFWSWRATTLGGIILNLRIERIDGRKVGIDVAVIRVLGCIFSAMALFFGFFWASWDSERQSWHDKIAGTTIVRVPRGHSLI